MQTILVTSDLSDRSRPAITRAVDLATRTGARLVALSVVSDDVPRDLTQALTLGAEALLKEQIEAELDGRPLDYVVAVKTGDPREVIPARAEEDAAALLVVGAHRRRKFLDQIRETTVEHIIRSSRTPVLLVTEGFDGPYRAVLAGTAFSKTCTTLPAMIAKVAPDAALTLFHAHAVSFAKEAEHEFDTWVSVYGLPRDLPHPILHEGTPLEALEAMMEAGTYDLLAIGGHTRADGGRYFTGRFTAGLIRKPPCDLLIAK